MVYYAHAALCCVGSLQMLYDLLLVSVSILQNKTLHYMAYLLCGHILRSFLHIFEHSLSPISNAGLTNTGSGNNKFSYTVIRSMNSLEPNLSATGCARNAACALLLALIRLSHASFGLFSFSDIIRLSSSISALTIHDIDKIRFASLGCPFKAASFFTSSA